LDMASADEMERVIRDDQLDCPLVVDLRDVDFIDSTGLRRVLGLRNTALSNGQALALVPPGLAADRIFTLTGDMRSVQLADARLAKQGCDPPVPLHPLDSWSPASRRTIRERIDRSTVSRS
jgi:anti-anti-sigma factor